MDPDLQKRLEAMEQAISRLAENQAQLTATMQEFVTTQPQALAGAMREVLTDRDVLATVGSTGAELMQEAAVAQTGGWVWRTVRSLFGGWLAKALLVLIVLKMAGFDAASKAVTLLTGGKV